MTTVARLLVVVLALIGVALVVQSRQREARAVEWQARQLQSLAVADVPVQATTSRAPFSVDRFRLEPVAEFAVRARVLSREDYRFDREARLSPTDLALGWGRMADPAVYRRLDISQGGRFYRWRYQGDPPIPHREIVESSANMHLIPADAAVSAALATVRAGDMVRFRGLLVNASDPDGGRWLTSTTRADSGAGACEVIWVEALTVERP